MDYSPWGRKESDRTERPSLSQNYSHQDSMLLLLLLLLSCFGRVQLCATP